MGLETSVSRGKAWEPMGSGGSISLPIGLNPTNTFTIEGKLLARVTTGTQVVFGKSDTKYQLQAEISGGNMLFYSDIEMNPVGQPGVTTFKSISLPIPAGRWFYFACVMDLPTGKMTLQPQRRVSSRLQLAPRSA